jgi:hypothetical protein
MQADPGDHAHPDPFGEAELPAVTEQMVGAGKFGQLGYQW